MVDLNTQVIGGLSGYLLTASAINDRGQILAQGCDAASCRTYRLDPVAEPAAVTAIPMMSKVSLAAMTLLLLASRLLLRCWSSR